MNTEEKHPITKEDLKSLVIEKLGILQLTLVERAQDKHWTELHRNQCMRASDQIFALLKILQDITLLPYEDY